MTILVTGSAGFIGSDFCLKLLERGDSVIGIDNHNDYYDLNVRKPLSTPSGPSNIPIYD